MVDKKKLEEVLEKARMAGITPEEVEIAEADTEVIGSVVNPESSHRAEKVNSEEKVSDVYEDTSKVDVKKEPVADEGKRKTSDFYSEADLKESRISKFYNNHKISSRVGGVVLGLGVVTAIVLGARSCDYKNGKEEPSTQRDATVFVYDGRVQEGRVEQFIDKNNDGNPDDGTKVKEFGFSYEQREKENIMHLWDSVSKAKIIDNKDKVNLDWETISEPKYSDINPEFYSYTDENNKTYEFGGGSSGAPANINDTYKTKIISGLKHAYSGVFKAIREKLRSDRNKSLDSIVEKFPVDAKYRLKE